MNLINWEIAGNPYNWIVIFLITVLIGMSLAAIFPQPASTGE